MNTYEIRYVISAIEKLTNTFKTTLCSRVRVTGFLFLRYEHSINKTQLRINTKLIHIMHHGNHREKT